MMQIKTVVIISELVLYLHVNNKIYSKTKHNSKTQFTQQCFMGLIQQILVKDILNFSISKASRHEKSG
jgi:hypothetical protein